MSLLTLNLDVQFRRRHRGRREACVGPEPQCVAAPGRVPRIARLMALALRFESLVRNGTIADYAELAKLGHVTPARISQIMSLLQLAPDIQEEVLFLARVQRGRDPIHLRDLQVIAAKLSWKTQRNRWRKLRSLARIDQSSSAR